MAAIAASDLTYTVLQRDLKQIEGKIHGKAIIAFGDGALTYPAAGVPLSKGKLGCPRALEVLKVIESDMSGYLFEYDASAETLLLGMVPEIDADPAAVIPTQPLDEATTSIAPAAMTLLVEYVGW